VGDSVAEIFLVLIAQHPTVIYALWKGSRVNHIDLLVSAQGELESVPIQQRLD
jgi:hypothetical protein